MSAPAENLTGEPVADSAERPARHPMLVWAWSLVHLDFVGVGLGALFFCLSLTPSLLPRDWLFQGLIGGINAANWIYVSIVERTAAALKAGEHVEVPTGVLLFPNDLAAPAPEAWIRRSYHLAQRNISDRGGHFPAMEHGDMLTADMRAFFRTYR